MRRAGTFNEFLRRQKGLREVVDKKQTNASRQPIRTGR
ncbi:hypothetical protein FRUB_08730 [Fimbriiglobus ruber]|uniref:Uncharacterized protein n=1 Tax=Fimbriiglobus ruber TaxID=1908690 RepID=A0A225DJ64_9BACT|nr:hypothetical protein FRUB_08730 [Fimbriiglobus ruber]